MGLVMLVQGISAANLEGLGQMQQAQGMQQMMQQMMNNPMMQNMLNNPEMLRNIMQSNPQVQQVRIPSLLQYFECDGCPSRSACWLVSLPVQLTRARVQATVRVLVAGATDPLCNQAG